MQRTSLVLLVSVAILGCARSFQALGPIDGASPDGGSILDASIADDGSDSGRDASADAGHRADAPDAGSTCASGYELVDHSPITIPGRHATISTDGNQFWIGFWHTEWSACDSPCWGTVGLEAEGALSRFESAHWLSTPDGLLQYTSPRTHLTTHAGLGRAMFVSHKDGRAMWQTRPLRGEGWMPDGSHSLSEGRAIADVALGADGMSVFIATYAPDDADGDRDFALERRSLDGTSLLTNESVPSFFELGFHHANVRIIAGQTDAPWIAAIQDYDFPPGVQVARAGAVSRRTSSCGVRSYDAADAFDQLAVVQDCDDRTELETRTGVEASIVVREGRAPTPSRVAVHGPSLFVAHVEPLGTTPSLSIVRRAEPGRLELMHTIALPPTADPAGSLDLTVQNDGTVAVLWSTLSPDPSPDAGEVAIVRLRPCGP